MSKVEYDFMKKAPSNPEQLMSFIDEIPYWTNEKHGKRYRLMYQVCMHPKYIEYGKQFLRGSTRDIPRMQSARKRDSGSSIRY